MLSIIVYAILISTLLNMLLKRLDLPTIIGYITTGTIIAYAFDLHEAVNNKQLQQIAEFGIVFLMFTIGLEFSFRSLKKMKGEVFVNGTLQVVFTTVIFTLIAIYIFGIEVKSALIISTALSLSSTAIVLKILNENGDINKPYGRHVLAILLFQDISVVVILLMMTMFASVDQPIAILLLETLGAAVILLFTFWIMGRYVLDGFFHFASHSGSSEIFIASVLLTVMGASYLAHMLDFSYSFGAFIAGMILAETHFKHQVEADLIPFRDLLLGLFFVTVGMQIDFVSIMGQLWIILLLLVAIISAKIVIVYFIVRYKCPKRTALKSAFSLFQVGEFSLAVFEIARAQSLLDEHLGQILIAAIVLSMVMTPFVLKNIGFLVDQFIVEDAIECELKDKKVEKLTDHTIVIGYGHLGKYVSKMLHRTDKEYVVIEHNSRLVEKAGKRNLPIIFGNGAQKNILEAVNIKEAANVIITVENPHKLQLICSTIYTLKQNEKTVVYVSRKDEKKSLKKFHLGHIVVQDEDTAQKMIEVTSSEPELSL